MKNRNFILDISKPDLITVGRTITLNKKNYDIKKSYILSGNTKIDITKRFVDNGDFFLYFDIKNPKTHKICLKLNKIFRVYTFENYYEKPAFDDRYGLNNVTGPFAYLNFMDGTAVVSKLYYYKKLCFEYSNERHSSLLELKEENMDIEIDTYSININISNISENCSFFILLSDKQLFIDKKHCEYYFKDYFKGVKNNDVLNSYFIRYNGTYTKLPYSIEPFTKDGYGFNLMHSSKRELIKYLQKNGDRYYYDFIVNAIMQTFLYHKNDNGIFYTPYTSTWLKKDTGITAPYIDTRLNESLNIMLNSFKEIYPEFDIVDNTQNYCEFLIRQAEKGNVYKIKDGIFFPDYFSENITIKTHSSLNHQLGIINLMLSLYNKIKKPRYLETAQCMLKFLESTHNLWINPENNNLFYGIRIKNNEIEMFGNDYIFVTLLDLLLIQQSLEVNNLVKNPVLDDLIFSKMEYLNNFGFSIFDSNAALASGEMVSSRKLVLKLYTREYFYLNEHI